MKCFYYTALIGQRKLLPRGKTKHHRTVSLLNIRKPSMTSSKGYRRETDQPWISKVSLNIYFKNLLTDNNKISYNKLERDFQISKPQLISQREN